MSTKPAPGLNASAAFAMLAAFAIVGVACGAHLPLGWALVAAFLGNVVLSAIVGGAVIGRALAAHNKP